MIYLSTDYGLVPVRHSASFRTVLMGLLVIWFPSNKERYRTNKRLYHGADGLHSPQQRRVIPL